MGSYDFTIVIKSYEERTFTGYITAEVIDHDGDIVPVDVLDAAMGPYLKRGGPLLVVHQALPVGILTQHFITTHPETLTPAIAVYGKIHNDGSSLFDEIWREFTNPSTPVGFSIGAKPLSWRVEVRKARPVRIFQKIELYEVSVVCEFMKRKHEPANQFANLIGLGHVDIAAPIPAIASKVIIKMADPDKNEIENKAEQEKPDEEVEKVEDMEKTLRDKIAKEAEQMLGGSTALKLLKEEQGKNAELTKTIQALSREVETYKLALSQEQKKVEDISMELKTQQISTEVWREMFKKNATNEDALKSMISGNRVVSNAGGIPPNQGSAPSMPMATKTRENVTEINKYLNGEMGMLSDEQFLKIRALARNVGGN